MSLKEWLLCTSLTSLSLLDNKAVVIFAQGKYITSVMIY